MTFRKNIQKKIRNNTRRKGRKRSGGMVNDIQVSELLPPPPPLGAPPPPQQTSLEPAEVPLTKEEKKVKAKKAAIKRIILTVRNLMSNLITLDSTLDSEKKNPILLINYDARNMGLTISYPFFDLNDVKKIELFVTHFTQLCNITNIISDVTSIVILFHRGLDVKKYRDIIIDGKEDDAVDTLYTISTEFGVRLLDNNMTSSKLVANVKTMSTTIYEKITDPKTKDIIDDFNSPKKQERLQVANDGTSLMFYLNPQGSSRQTFAPTGHGGRNGFIQFTGRDGILYLCANIANRGRDGNVFITFNAFGGSPDFNEEPSITVFREMIEEMFEKLYRRVISDEELAAIANGYKLLSEILGSDVTSFDKLRKYLGSIHNYDSVLSEKLQPISLIDREHGLNWNGMGFPNHTLPDGTQVLSLTTYNLTNVTTALSPENIIKLLSLTYAKQELKGSFIIKTTPTYIKFFEQLNNLLLNSTYLYLLEQGIDRIIREIGLIDFLLISFEGSVYSNDFKIKYKFDPDDNIYNMLIISITFTNSESVDKTEEIALFKIAIDKKTMRVVSNNVVPKDGTEFYTNGGGELFFVEKFRLRKQIGDQTAMITEETSGGRKRTKRTKRMKTKRNKTYKKRRYRRYGK